MRCCVCGEKFETDLPCNSRALMACPKPARQRAFKQETQPSYYWQNRERRKEYQRQYYRKKILEAIQMKIDTGG